MINNKTTLYNTAKNIQFLGFFQGVQSARKPTDNQLLNISSILVDFIRTIIFCM